MEGNRAPDQQKNCEGDNQNPIVQGEINEATDHAARSAGNTIFVAPSLSDRRKSPDHWDSSICSSGAGSMSPSRATHAYKVGSRKMLSSNPEIRPPTITIANGRCESEPMACDNAAGTRPSVATSIVIMIGRKRRTAPSTAASS